MESDVMFSIFLSNLFLSNSYYRILLMILNYFSIVFSLQSYFNSFYYMKREMIKEWPNVMDEKRIDQLNGKYKEVS